MTDSLNPATKNVERRMVEGVRELFVRLPVGTVVSSKEVARTLGISDGEAQPLTRAVILQVVREGLPIGADSKGYRVLKTEGELRSYLADLEQRRQGIKARMLSTERAFRNHWGSLAATPLDSLLGRFHRLGPGDRTLDSWEDA